MCTSFNTEIDFDTSVCTSCHAHTHTYTHWIEREREKIYKEISAGSTWSSDSSGYIDGAAQMEEKKHEKEEICLSVWEETKKSQCTW